MSKPKSDSKTQDGRTVLKKNKLSLDNIGKKVNENENFTVIKKNKRKRRHPKNKNEPSMANNVNELKSQNGGDAAVSGISVKNTNEIPETQRNHTKNLNSKSKVQVKAENVDCNWKILSLTLKKSNPKPKPQTKKENEIWFDGVDEIFLEKNLKERSSVSHLVKPKSFSGLTKVIGMDCEMVGVGMNGETSMLARISIVNHFGNCIYDKYVKCQEEVTDYRTHVSGIRPFHLEKGERFEVVQKEVSDIFKDRILVGHALSHDLKVLYLSHPKRKIRDTAKFKKFRNMFGGRTPSLRNLTERLLGIKIQDGEHSSVQDAQAAIRLYTMFRKEWETSINKKFTTSAKSDTCNPKQN